MMRSHRVCLLLLPLAAVAAGFLSGPSLAQSPAGWVEQYRQVAARIIEAATADSHAWGRLAEMVDTFGPRLSGSPQLDAAIAWAADGMKKDGLENVRAEPVMVPRWVRGEEAAEIVKPVPQRLAMLGLGGSVGTPPAGVEAELIAVESFDELKANAAKARGRIVLFNVPFTSYGQTVAYRVQGASQAARVGAVAALVRSVGPMGLRTPHTGVVQYEDDAPRIPAAAIAAEDAAQLQRMQDRGTAVVVRLNMGAGTEPDVESANLVGEVVGREHPEQVVVLGCHSDSWDVGDGAVDDGGGCVAVWEAAAVMKRLGLRPRRTVRVVWFVNEENGLRGGLAYRDRHAGELVNHVLMMELDAGLYAPRGFGFSGSDGARAIVTGAASLLGKIGATRIGPGGGGADIGPSVQAGKIASMALDVDAGDRYFLVHHSPADTVERIDPGDMGKCVAAVAVMAYVVADVPERLPR